MDKCLLLFLSLLVTSLQAQNLTKGFRQLSRPEKCWTIAHPFAAKKAWACTQRARFVTDSLQKAGVLSDGQGGQLDAFRHAYWMALLVNSINSSSAEKLGIRHEQGNYLDYRHRIKEDSSLPDSMACEMDLFNNNIGITIGLSWKNDSDSAKKSLAEMVLFAVWNGRLHILKKDAVGNYLTCLGKRINLADYKEKWNIPKCLVASNEIVIKH